MTTSSKNTKPNKSDSTKKLKLDWNQCQQCKLVILKSNNEDHVENVCSNTHNVLESLNQPFLCQNYANLSLTEHKGKSFEAMPSQSGFMGIKVECQFRFSKNRQHSRQNIQIELV